MAITSPTPQARRLYNTSFLLPSCSKQNDCKEITSFCVGSLNHFPCLMVSMVIVCHKPIFSPGCGGRLCPLRQAFSAVLLYVLAELSPPFRHMFLISNKENNSNGPGCLGGVLRHFICCNDHSFKDSYSKSPKPWQQLIFQGKDTVG